MTTESGPPPLELTIPFQAVRMLLPPDGAPPEKPELKPIYARNTVFSVIGTVDKWGYPPHVAQGRFMRDECLEIAFGYILRAKEDDRGRRGRHEQPWYPGFAAMQDHIAVRGGWRMHLAAPGSDFFDGVFTGKLRAVIDKGRLRVRMDEVKIDWFSDVIRGVLARPVESLVSSLAEVYVNDWINTNVNERVNDAVRDSPMFAAIRSAVDVRINGTNLSILVTPPVTLDTRPGRADLPFPPHTPTRPDGSIVGGSDGGDNGRFP
jgi:hypothetical protein